MKTKAIATVALLMGLLLNTAAQAGAYDNDRRGWNVGFDFGVGGGQLSFERPAGKFESDEDQPGASFGVRGGYGFSDRFVLGLDARGFESTDRGLTTGLCTTVVMATWYPSGGGFFLRGGLGAGRIRTELDADATLADVPEFKKHGGVLALGLGYEWRVSRRFALGLSLDARGIAVDDFDDLHDVQAGFGSVGLQFGWYL